MAALSLPPRTSTATARSTSNAGDGIFYGKGDGTFTSTTNGTSYSPIDVISIASNGGNFGNTAAAIDLNKDGKPDLIIGNTILINIYGSAPVVSSLATTTTTLAASPASATVGSSVALTATITPASGSIGLPTGSVTFLDGTAALGTPRSRREQRPRRQRTQPLRLPQGRTHHRRLCGGMPTSPVALRRPLR